MISIPASPHCELARWSLDRWGIPYDEECHAPVLHAFVRRQQGGRKVVPMVDTGEALLVDVREVLDYYEARSPLDLKLFPTDARARAETEKLVDFFVDPFGIAVLAWAYAHMLPVRDMTTRAWTAGVPLWERLVVRIFYPFLAAAVRQNLALESSTVAEHQQVIESALAQIESRLADGRRFLREMS